jgi:uncharacterized protein
MNSFFRPLTDFIPGEKNNRNASLLWISVILFLTIKITWGNADYFESRFGNYFSDSAFHSWGKWIYHHFSSLLMFAVFPALFIRNFLKEDVSDYGIGAGDWRYGLKATLIALLILPLPLYIASHDPEHLKTYPLVKLDTGSPAEVGLWALFYLPHYIGWEFFFRGYIGFGMKKHYGAFVAIMLQTLLTTLEHIGKPPGEIIGAIPAGIYLGLLTYRTGSIWWAVVFHWYLGVVNSYFCSL